jgi:hypothetical protein
MAVRAQCSQAIDSPAWAEHFLLQALFFCHAQQVHTQYAKLVTQDACATDLVSEADTHSKPFRQQTN